MKICDDLRQAVLQAAIQGKLTTQRPEDGDARELLKQIAAEKAKLIKEKKIKNDKKIALLEDDELLPVPDNWACERVGKVFNLQAGKNISGSAIKDECTLNSYPCYGGNGLRGYVETYNMVGRYPIIGRQGALCGNINIANGKFYATEHAVVVSLFAGINPDFAALFMKALNFNQYATATAQPGLAVANIDQVVFPLPPLAEQHRIVAKVEKLMAEIDELEKVENELHALKTAFPGDMKAALLQAAMQGKLTTQRKEDGDARDLLKQIAKEKAQLIKEKKIKKEKPLSEITEEEIPFDVPENWVWVKFGQIVNYNMGKTPPRKDDTYWGNANIPWVSIADMVEDGYINITKEKINEYSQEKIFKGKISSAGTLLMSFKLTVGRTSILNIDAYHNEAIISIYPSYDLNNILRNYLFKIMPLVTGFGKSKSAMKGATLNSDSISNLLIPLPPLAEQQRIVAKLEKLLPLCDGLVEE